MSDEQAAREWVEMRAVKTWDREACLEALIEYGHSKQTHFVCHTRLWSELRRVIERHDNKNAEAKRC